MIISRKYRHIYSNEYFWLALLFIIVFILYFKSFKVGFLSDDFDLFYDYKVFLNPFSGYRWLPFQGFAYWLIHILDLSPLIIRIVVFLLHFINIFLIFKIITRLLKNKVGGIIAAFIFALFYRHPQVIYNIFVLIEVVFGTFFLTTILFYLNFQEKKQKIYYWLSVFTFVIALLVKEAAIMLLPILFVLEALILNKLRLKKIKTVILIYLPFVTISAIYLIFTRLTSSSFSHFSKIGYYPVELKAGFHNFFNILLGYAPIKFHDQPLNNSSITLVYFILIIIGLALILFFKKQLKLIVFFLSITVLLAIPYAFFSPYGYNDKYLYVGSFGFAGLAATIIYSLSEKFTSNLKIIFLSIFVLIWFLLSYNLISWRSNDFIKAGQIASDIQKQIKSYCEQFGVKKSGYLINFPMFLGDDQIFIFNNGLVNMIRKTCNKPAGYIESFNLNEEEIKTLVNSPINPGEDDYIAFGYIDSKVQNLSGYYDKIQQIIHDQVSTEQLSSIFKETNGWTIERSTTENDLKISNMKEGFILKYKIMPGTWIFLYHDNVPVIKDTKIISLDILGDAQNESLYLDLFDRETGSYFRFKQKIDWSGWKPVKFNLADAKLVGDNISLDETDDLKISLDSDQNLKGELILTNFHEY